MMRPIRGLLTVTQSASARSRDTATVLPFLFSQHQNLLSKTREVSTALNMDALLSPGKQFLVLTMWRSVVFSNDTFGLLNIGFTVSSSFFDDSFFLRISAHVAKIWKVEPHLFTLTTDLSTWILQEHLNHQMPANTSLRYLPSPYMSYMKTLINLLLITKRLSSLPVLSLSEISI